MDAFFNFTESALAKCLCNSIMTDYYFTTSCLFNRRLMLILSHLILCHILF